VAALMARLGIAGVALGWLLTSSLGLGCARLDAQGREALVAQGRQLFADKGCYGCHTIGAAGTPIGPDLRAASARYGESTLARWLRDPAAQEPTRHMPKLDLTEAEAGALAAYLASLR
jgi:mono/diheme cytochrome c family protein